MVLIGRRFIAVSENKNQAEAEYRYVLTRLRENGESIALIQGRRGRARRRRQVSADGVARLARYLPSEHEDHDCLPDQRLHRAGPADNSVRAQVSSTARCRSARSCRRRRHSRSCKARSTGWSTTIRGLPTGPPRPAASPRCKVSLDALERCRAAASAESSAAQAKGAALRLRNLSVTLDDGTAVVDDTEVAIMPGERVLVAGESGTGKSTLVRAIAGLWPWGEGEIEIEEGREDLSCCRSAPMCRSGTLRRAANYPEAAASRSVDEVAKALKKVGLDHLVERLEEEVPGIRPYRVVRNSAWLSREFSFIVPTSSCSMRRLPRLIHGARIN